MSLESVMHFGYSVIIISILLMLWITYASGTICHFDPYCTCTSLPPHLGQVECKDVHVNLPQLNHTKLFTLSLINNEIYHLPPSLLAGTGLYKLEIRDNPVFQLHEDTLLGLERSLWELHVTNCKLSSFPGNALRHLSKLKTLNLSGNAITTISADQLKGVSISLQSLILADNQISSLPQGVFASLLQMDTLDLRRNAILSLEPSVFTPAPPKLRELDLSDNLIETMSYKQLGNIKSLHILNLAFNRLTTLADPSSNAKLSLGQLILDYNLIGELDANSFANFEVANTTSFKGNPLAFIQRNAFQGCRIIDLILADCQLSDIDPESFNGLDGTLHHLDLSGNNITTFGFPLIMQYERLRSLSLDFNTIKDVEWMKFPKGINQDIQITELRISGKNNKVKLQNLPKMVHLQTLSISSHNSFVANDFENFSVELETLIVSDSGFKSLDPHIFKFVRGIKTLDLTDNAIENVDAKSLLEISHSLENLILTHSLSKSVGILPRGFLKPLSSLRNLKINHNFMVKIPIEIGLLSNLELLHAQDNNFEGIPKGLFKAGIHKNLQEINLSFNKIGKVTSGSFVELDDLLEINLSDNNIVKLEANSFVNLNRLTNLWLRGNKIEILAPETFQNLPALRNIDLAYNHLKEFSFSCLDQVGMLTSLNINILDMSNNNISYVEREYFMPVQHSLSHLFLSHNAIQNLTADAFSEMPHLQLLDIRHNYIDELEFDSLRGFRNLQVLLISNNKIEHLPQGVFHSLNVLRVLDLSSNYLANLAESIISPYSIVRVDLSDNIFTRTPLSAFSPQAADNVLEIDLSRNRISSLPPGENFSRFTKLKHLDISWNRIADLGTSFHHLQCLNHLIIANNQLHIGARDFFGLENTLEHLDMSNITISFVPSLPLTSLLTLKISNNFLTFIPPDLQMNLTNLKAFDVSFNSLTSLPSIQQLKYLNIAGNQIIAISNGTFADFPNLIELDVRQLPLKDFDQEGLMSLKGLKSIIFSNYKQFPNFNIPKIIRENEAIRSVKLEIVGAPNIGSELGGALPPKVDHLSLTGWELKSLPDTLLRGVKNPNFVLSLKNTSVEMIQAPIFISQKNIRNITLDLSGPQLKTIANPSNTGVVNKPKTTYLVDLYMTGDQWTCDCKLGWIETWHRKRRQFSPRDYTIESARENKCKNKSNKSLLDVLKSEVECGWSRGVKNKVPLNILLLSFILIIFMR